MARWHLTHQLPNETTEDALFRIVQHLNAILADLETLEADVKGLGGRTIHLEGPLDLGGHPVTGVPARPEDGSSPITLAFLRSHSILKEDQPGA